MRFQPRSGQSWWPLVVVMAALLGFFVWEDAHRRHLEADAFEAAIPACVQAGATEGECEKRIEQSSRSCFRANYASGGKSQHEAFSGSDYQACVLMGYAEWSRSDRDARAAARARAAQEHREVQ